MTKPPVLYLAGPMTGIKHFNVEAFMKADEILTDLGYIVRNPARHDIETGFDPYQWNGTETLEQTGFDLDAALEWDLKQVREADAMVVLPLPNKKWVSEGLDLELAEAHKHGVAVIKLDKNWEETLKKGAHEKSVGIKCVKCADFLEYNVLPSMAGRSLRFTKKAEYTTGGYVTGGTTVSTKDWTNIGTPTAPDYIIPKDVVAKLGGETLALLKEASKATPVENPWTGDKGEVRSVSSTGGEKGVKLARYDLVPVGALRQIAEHYGRGAEKYDDNQWRKGYEWSKSYAALIRHANQFWGGEDFDEETGSNHMAAVAWHALTLLTFYDEHPEFDDRVKS